MAFVIGERTNSKEKVRFFALLLVVAMLFTALMVNRAAATTTLGTNIVTDGSLAATSTLQVTGAVTFYTTLGVTGNTTLSDDLVITGTASTTGAFASGGVLQAGSGTSVLAYSRYGTGTTGHGLAASDDLLVAGLAEFDDSVWFDGAVTAATTLTVTGNTALNDDLVITGTASTTGAFASGGALQVGSGTDLVAYSRYGTGTTGHGLAASDDLLVTGLAEFDDTVWFDGSLRASSTFMVTGNSTLTGTVTIGDAGTAITKHLSGTATNLTSASIATIVCADYGTITVTGAAVGDTVSASPDADSSATGIEDSNLSWSAVVTSANTVTIRACNPTAGGVDAGDDQEWRADVWKH